MSVASASASALPFEFALIGNLRPWEVEDCASRVVDRETARHFATSLHDYITKRIDRRPKPSDIEYIIRIAAEAYEILGDHRGVIGDVRDKDVVWSIFVKAIEGANIVDLEHFAARRIKETDATSASIGATTKLVKSYVAKNRVDAKALPSLLMEIHSVLENTVESSDTRDLDLVKKKPTAKQIENSVGPEGIVSFIDGKSYRTLRFHLRKYGLRPDEYRKRFNLPPDYPMAIKILSSKKTTPTSKIFTGSKSPTVKHRSGRQARSA